MTSITLDLEKFGAKKDREKREGERNKSKGNGFRERRETERNGI